MPGLPWEFVGPILVMVSSFALLILLMWRAPSRAGAQDFILAASCYFFFISGMVALLRNVMEAVG